jgi:hypothetical protein
MARVGIKHCLCLRFLAEGFFLLARLGAHRGFFYGRMGGDFFLCFGFFLERIFVFCHVMPVFVFSM